MSGKPTITLKIGGGSGQSFNLSGRSPSAQPGTPTPSGAPKIKLNFGGSKPSTPSEPLPPPIQKTKAGRTPKPSAKLAANKNGKRMKEESDDEDDEAILLQRHPLPTERQPQPKKLKLNLGGGGGIGSGGLKTPTVLKAKFKGKPPKRPLGEGYDSEASDRESDPLIEEEFVLRMMPGEDCEYLRKAIQERTIGLPRNQGGADIQMKFLHADGRRAVVTIRGHMYAATLVDLPTVVEGMKSWDKRGWWKSADICQMLLVFARVNKESEASTIELPKIVDPQTFQYPHGLTPPMHFARKRRFRNRISRTAIEAVEEAVEKLLEADARADSVRHEIIEPERAGRDMYGSPDAYGEDEEYSEDEEADADGEVDDQNNYFSQINGQQGEQQEEDYEVHPDLEADLEAAFEADFENAMDAGTPADGVAETPIAAVVSGTPDATGNVNGEGDDLFNESSDESVEDDDEEGEGGSSDVDEDQKAALAQRQGALEDIAEMEKQLAMLQAQLEQQANPLLQKRIKSSIEKVKAELQLKKSAIGEGDED